MGAALSEPASGETLSDPAQRHRPGRSRRPQGIGRRSYGTPSPGACILPTRSPGFPALTSGYPAALPNLSRTRPAPLRCYHRPLLTRGWGRGPRGPAPPHRAARSRARFPPCGSVFLVRAAGPRPLRVRAGHPGTRAGTWFCGGPDSRADRFSCPPSCVPWAAAHPLVGHHGAMAVHRGVQPAVGRAWKVFAAFSAPRPCFLTQATCTGGPGPSCPTSELERWPAWVGGGKSPGRGKVWRDQRLAPRVGKAWLSWSRVRLPTLPSTAVPKL